MGTTSANMTLQLPTLGADPGTYDDQLNASLALLDLHDHSAGRGVKVKTNGLDVNADLTFASFAALNLKAAGFATQASYSVARSLWVKTSDNELYWRNNAGVDVKMTSGAGLNMSLVGGITGDYAAASASFYYDDANATYRALNAAPLPNDWAALAAGNLDLYEKVSGAVNRVRLQSPAALAASYALTFPAALPGSTQLLQVSSAGAITATNTVTQSTTFSGGLVATGAADFDGAASISLPARKRQISANAGTEVGNGSAGATCWTGDSVLFTGSYSWDIPIPLHEGDRITAIKVFYNRAAGSLSFGLIRVNDTGVVSSLCAKTIAAGTGDANTEIGTAPTSGSLPQTLAADRAYVLRASCNNLDEVMFIVVTYDRP